MHPYIFVIIIALQDRVPNKREQLLAPIVERMLGKVDRARYVVRRSGHRLQIDIAGSTINLNPGDADFEHHLERLAWAIESSIASQRASAMLSAAGAQNECLPLWLVTGSSVLARWLTWSRSEGGLQRVLMMSDQADAAPVVGAFERSARAALGQMAVKFRVRNGLAVAEKITLPAQQRCIMTLGQTARATVPNYWLPNTVVAALAGRSMSQLIGHPFFIATNLIIAAARIEGQALVVEFQHHWGPLAQVPEAALAAVPADADPACPWRPTSQEVVDLYALVDALRGHGRGA